MEVQCLLFEGVPFAEAADRHSDCKDKGGDLGEFPAGHMVEDFDKAIRALEPGQCSGVFTTPFGFHIALLHSRTAAGPGVLDDFRTGIERVLTFAKQHEAYRRGVAELRTKADIRCVEPESQPRHQPQGKPSRRERRLARRQGKKVAAHQHA